jgi:hypothetical protein
VTPPKGRHREDAFRSGKNRPSLEEREEIRERLRQHIRSWGGSVAEFQRKTGIPKHTLDGWLHSSDPKTPNTPQLIKLARKVNLNLNWLLLGELPELREAPAVAGDLEQRLRARVIATLRSRTDIDTDLLDASVPSGDRMLQLLVVRVRARLADSRVSGPEQGELSPREQWLDAGMRALLEAQEEEDLWSS